MQNLKITPISIKGNPKKSSIISILIAEQAANKEFLAGKVFVLSDIAKDKKNAEKINAFLIDRINYFYYEGQNYFRKESAGYLTPKIIH